MVKRLTKDKEYLLKQQQQPTAEPQPRSGRDASTEREQKRGPDNLRAAEELQAARDQIEDLEQANQELRRQLNVETAVQVTFSN